MRERARQRCLLGFCESHWGQSAGTVWPSSRAGEGSEQALLNRLAAIQAAAEILDDNADLSPSERRLFVLAIRTETTRLHQLIAR